MPKNKRTKKTTHHPSGSAGTHHLNSVNIVRNIVVGGHGVFMMNIEKHHEYSPLM